MSLKQRFLSDATSASGAMRMHRPGTPVRVGVMLAKSGTSSAPPLSPWPQAVQQTTAGASVLREERAGVGIAELRRLSGFTWEQLARLFKVSRRSLHLWASGKPMTPGHEEHLQRLLSVIRKINRGSASANRAELLAVGADGSIPFDLLAAGQYDRVVSLLGPGDVRRVAVPKLSAEALAARAPRPPEEIVGALQDRVHRDTGIVRPAKSTKVWSGR